jgi:hypothetical protein
MTKNNWWERRMIASLIVALIITFLPFEVVKTASAEPSEQVISSGIGFADTGHWQSPVGSGSGVRTKVMAHMQAVVPARCTSTRKA